MASVSVEMLPGYRVPGVSRCRGNILHRVAGAVRRNQVQLGSARPRQVSLACHRHRTGESDMSSSQDRWVWHAVVVTRHVVVDIRQVNLSCCRCHVCAWTFTLLHDDQVSATSFVGYIRIFSQDCWISPFRQKDWFCVAHKWVKLGVCILMYQNIANQNYQ